MNLIFHGRGWRTPILASAFFCLFGYGLAIGAENKTSGSALPGPDAGQTVNLQYRELDKGLIDVSLKITSRSEPYAKEPALSGRKVRRGSICFEGSSSQDLPFLWDYTQGKLYLDLNRNQDLTDDGSNLLSNERSYYSSSYQHFPKAHLTVQTASGTYSLAGEISLYSFSSLDGSFECHSFWEGRVSLQGDEWQVGYLENVFSQRGSDESRYLIVRPWAAREQPLSLEASAADGFAFATNLFLNGQAYRVACTAAAQGKTSGYRFSIREQSAPLGTLRVNGRSIERLILAPVSVKDGFMVVLDSPAFGEKAKVPVGSYRLERVWLKAGGQTAYRKNESYRFVGDKADVTIGAASEAVLTAGGPLTNTVSVSREGGALLLAYRLVGAEGRPYQLAGQNRVGAPGFAVTQNGKPVFSGKFEFG